MTRKETAAGKKKRRETENAEREEEAAISLLIRTSNEFICYFLAK